MKLTNTKVTTSWTPDPDTVLVLNIVVRYNVLTGYTASYETMDDLKADTNTVLTEEFKGPFDALEAAYELAKKEMFE